MDIFLSPGDSPLTITPGDTTLHIRVSRSMDTTPQTPAPAPALPVMATPTAERQSVMTTHPRWRRPTMIGLGILAMLFAGLYSHMRNTPASSLAPQVAHLDLPDPPEFPTRPVPRQQALPLPQSDAAPVQRAPSPLNQAFGLH